MAHDTRQMVALAMASPAAARAHARRVVIAALIAALLLVGLAMVLPSQAQAPGHRASLRGAFTVSLVRGNTLAYIHQARLA